MLNLLTICKFFESSYRRGKHYSFDTIAEHKRRRQNSETLSGLVDKWKYEWN